MELCLAYPEHSAAQINVFEPQPSHFPAAQSGGVEQDDREPSYEWK